jgi:hypothetical protein
MHALHMLPWSFFEKRMMTTPTFWWNTTCSVGASTPQF